MADSGDVSSADLPARQVASADRDRVVEVLTRHYAEDRISEDELEARLDRVYRAATLPELNAVLADLPAAAEAAAPRIPAIAGPGDTAIVRAPRRISALLAGREQSLSGVVTGRVEIRSRLAHIALDLTQATFEPGVTEIDVRAILGDVELRLPGSVRLETEVRVVLGDFSVSGGSGAATTENAAVVRITGRVVLGAAQCIVHAVGNDAGGSGPGTD